MADAEIYSLRWLGERATAALAIIGICSAVFGVVWAVARNEIVDVMSEMTGVPVLTQEIRIHAENTNAAVDRLTAIVERTAARIEEFHPPKVAEYDEFRSMIFTPCAVGKDCEAQYRVRRTAFGGACKLPRVVGRFVTDRFGVEHSVAPPKTSPTRVDGEWSIRNIIFTVPPRVPLGVASFHMVLEYECDGGTVTEETPHLPFEIIQG